MCLTGDADRKIVGDGVIGLQVGGHRYDVNETKKIAANTSSSLIQIETTISAQATSFTDEAKKIQFQNLFSFSCRGNSPGAFLER